MPLLPASTALVRLTAILNREARGQLAEIKRTGVGNDEIPADATAQDMEQFFLNVQTLLQVMLDHLHKLPFLVKRRGSRAKESSQGDPSSNRSRRNCFTKGNC